MPRTDLNSTEAFTDKFRAVVVYQDIIRELLGVVAKPEAENVRGETLVILNIPVDPDKFGDISWRIDTERRVQARVRADDPHSLGQVVLDYVVRQ